MVSGSITHWLVQLRKGNRDAAQPIWEKYFCQLVRLARIHLNGSPRRVADEEDVVICAFDSFCRGAEQGRFPKLDDSTDLWRVLVTITERKAINQARNAARKKRSPIGGTIEFVDDEHVQQLSPSPWFCARVAELFIELISDLRDDQLRSVAILRMEGYSNEEIASKMDCSVRSIERKLAMIRRRWIESNES
jgi:DNA-directed RNA polymerase specialized sigma24 family protein